MQSTEPKASDSWIRDLRTPEEQARMSAYMAYEGTDAATANVIAAAVIDVWGAHYGIGSYVPFSLRYGIAHEVQRRLAIGEVRG